MLGKHARLSFNSHLPMRATNLLHVVHYDVCSPLETPTLGGNLYFVTFGDEYIRMM